MTLSINMRPGAAANGGIGIGVMTSAGNPWPVPDGLAQDLINRGLALPVGWPANPSGSLPAALVPAVQALVLVDGNLAYAAVASTTGTAGQVAKLSDGPDKGACLVWAIPEGRPTYAWCWQIYPLASYL